MYSAHAEEGEANAAADATAEAAAILRDIAVKAAEELKAEQAAELLRKKANKKAAATAAATRKSAAEEEAGGSSKPAAAAAPSRASGRAGKATLEQEQLDEEKAAKDVETKKRQGENLHS